MRGSFFSFSVTFLHSSTCTNNLSVPGQESILINNYKAMKSLFIAKLFFGVLSDGNPVVMNEKWPYYYSVVVVT